MPSAQNNVNTLNNLVMSNAAQVTPAPSPSQIPTDEPTPLPNQIPSSETTPETPYDKVAVSPSQTPFSSPKPSSPQDAPATFGGFPMLVNSNNLLSPDYVPTTLVDIKGTNFKLDSECASALAKMQAAALLENLSLPLKSAYRDYNTQSYLFRNKTKALTATYGDNAETEAAKIVARPGASEHQTGLAADVGKSTASFADTQAGIWLANHAHEYGFVVRYADDKQEITGIIYEPWHIRYVGADAAKYMYENGLCLEEYITLKTGETLENAP